MRLLVSTSSRPNQAVWRIGPYSYYDHSTARFVNSKKYSGRSASGSFSVVQATADPTAAFEQKSDIIGGGLRVTWRERLLKPNYCLGHELA